MTITIMPLLLLAACSKSPADKIRMGMEYQDAAPFVVQEGGSFLFASMTYIFSKQGVSVYYNIGPKGDIYQRQSDGVILTSDDYRVRAMGGTAVGGYRKGEILSKGNDPSTSVKVIFGPGDRMPVLQGAQYRVEGDSIFVDWSGGHSPYFAVTESGSGTEVWTVKNNGLLLDNVTVPGIILTLNMFSPKQ